MPKHKHSEVIKAWADGATIQYQKYEGCWFDVCNNAPHWAEESTYRVKPEPKPDMSIYLSHLVKGLSLETYAGMWAPADSQEVKWTIDGETGRIKSVQLLDK
jgi:hypothetical protein